MGAGSARDRPCPEAARCEQARARAPAHVRQASECRRGQHTSQHGLMYGCPSVFSRNSTLEAADEGSSASMVCESNCLMKCHKHASCSEAERERASSCRVALGRQFFYCCRRSCVSPTGTA